MREALALLASNQVAAAILDVNLSDGDVFPVVQTLIDRGIPVIIQTGVAAPAELKSRYPGVTVLAKPVKSEILLGKLMALLGHGSGDAGDA